MKTKYLPVIVLLFAVLPCSADDFQHDKWNTQPVDIRRAYTAFVVSFDNADDDDGDEIADVWGIPEWVSYEMRKVEDLGDAPDRPDWFTDEQLFEVKIAPDDRTYHFSREWRQQTIMLATQPRRCSIDSEDGR